MTIPFRFMLMELPDELIANVIEHLVKDRAALRNLSRTCKRIQYETERVLYRSITCQAAYDTESITLALASNENRRDAIKHFEAPCDPRHKQDFAAIATILSDAKNLVDFHFESPQVNNGNFEDDEIWNSMTYHIFAPLQAAADLAAEVELAHRPLQRLEKLTIHINGILSPYWDLDAKSLSIFRHPHLTHLRLSCVNILDRVADLISEIQGLTPTPLKILELDECNITHSGLHAILSLQRGLEALYLGENRHNVVSFPHGIDPASNYLFRTDPRAAMDSLCRHKDTLKELTYVTLEPNRHQDIHLRQRKKTDESSIDTSFADFRCLERVSLIGHCAEFERAVMTSRSPPNLHSLQFKAFNPLPLRADGDDELAQGTMSPLDTIPFLRAPACAVGPKLKSLQITYETFRQQPTPFEIRNNQRLLNTTKSTIVAAGNAAQKIGVTMKVMYVKNPLVIPPFLYGERVPREILVFNGHADGFVGRFAAYAPEWEDDDSEFDDSDDDDYSD